MANCLLDNVRNSAFKSLEEEGYPVEQNFLCENTQERHDDDKGEKVLHDNS